MLNDQNKQTDELWGGLGPQESVKDRRISICHVSEGSAWAGAEAHVATLLRVLSKCPEIALHAILTSLMAGSPRNCAASESPYKSSVHNKRVFRG